ncbi:hypothetical protein [Sphingomonas sp. VNH70]|uniref:hypothetical protein n=1 Tax=Sphingomonas silueang TaxID=3156617 RepID=UPI0032B45A3D
MATVDIDWQGPAIGAKMQAAQIAGVNGTMARCVQHAKTNHDWENRTATLEGGIAIVDYAVVAGAGVRGTWGVQDVVYALIHELGGVIKPVTAKALAFGDGQGGMVFVQSVTIPARPYLRPAADKLYPGLATRIRKAYERAEAAGE